MWSIINPSSYPLAFIGEDIIEGLKVNHLTEGGQKMGRIIRFVIWEEKKPKVIHDIFEFDLDKHRNKDRKFDAEVNGYVMDALEKVANGPFEVTVERG